jgi:histidinol-phosphate aminotransferase
MKKPKKKVKKAKYYPLPPLPEDAIRLHLNENPFGPPPKVRGKLKNIDPEELPFYPDPAPFREKLARSLGVSPEEVLPTNGADEAIQTIANTYLEEGDEVIIPSPTFFTFKKYAHLAGAKIIEVPYHLDLSFPKEELINAISDKTKLIVLITPDNPTGTILPEDYVIEVIEKAKNSLVVIDETYHQFAGMNFIHLIKRYDNIFIIESLSKVYGLAAARVGYIVSHKKNISLLSRVILPFTISAVSLSFASAALDDSQYIDFVLTGIKKVREFTFTRLDELGILYYPTRTNFFLMRLGLRAGMVVSYLKENGVFVRLMNEKALPPGCIRVTIGKKPQMERFIALLSGVACPEALIFDIDGVLIDVSRSCRQAIRRTVAEFTDYLPRPDELQEYKERGGLNDDTELVKLMIEERGVKVPLPDISALLNRYYFGEEGEEALYKFESLLIPAQAIARLAERFKLGIASGRTRREAELALTRFGIKDYFKAVVTLDETPEGKKKPHPYPVKRVMKMLEAKSAYYFGDNIDDINAGISAGAYPIGVIPPDIGGKRLGELLSQAGARLVLDRPGLIPDLFPEAT